MSTSTLRKAPAAPSAPTLPLASSSERPLPAPAAAVELRGLTKVYPGSGKTPPKTALAGIDLVIPRGSIFGLLGPNGAGKSTLINILAGLVIKTEGTARVWGIDIDVEPRNARAAIGVVPQEITIDFFFTPRELLELQAGFYGVPKRERLTDAILGVLALADKADVPARTLSGGMKRRLMMAKAMVHNPPVLVLDEPTAGVDVELRRQLWTHIRDLRAQGTTVLLTTHYLDEAELLCDRIAIIDQGRLVACDTTEALVKEVDDKTVRIAIETPLLRLPPRLEALGLELVEPQCLALRYRPSRTRIADVLAAVRTEGLEIRDIVSVEASLEDIFLRLVGAGAERRGADQ